MPRKQDTAIVRLPVLVELIERRIYLIRGHKVMFDSSLAELPQNASEAEISALIGVNRCGCYFSARKPDSAGRPESKI